jgi:hypothetical protein
MEIMGGRSADEMRGMMGRKRADQMVGIMNHGTKEAGNDGV